MTRRLTAGAPGSPLAGLIGGYSPARRAYRRYRPRWMAGLSPAGREILRFVERHGLLVSGGPFQGMRYPGRSAGHVSTFAAKLLGAYELELHRAVEELLGFSPAIVVNVGAGEGYYAVGAALRVPEATIEAFDADAGERSLCRALARENGVADRVHVHGFCDSAALRPLTGPDVLLIVDCEGYELDLLDPARIPSLAATNMLVELHPFARDGLVEEMVGRFRGTHDVRLIGMTERDAAQFPELAGMDPLASFLLLSEGWAPDAVPGPEQRLWAEMVAVSGGHRS
ncbi:MAG: hypothetical protein QOF77_1561 [Solirubrobacteraceae bacterium]|jgi:hypothetical protein|nr:hypothetical protein [Solirubrobacteraceae bacterium]